ncbi:Peptidase M10 domain containing protein [Asbolus verrucosus]|uniref:Peptidase M10 domain containing protein n=1 Tax=Asbolus verrucosus TaxID=1661398 RepID=A0A482VRQ6_ASBVE|nr:Peptidase M10 domain containing protein [Asbolus verrucosus]
MPKHPRIKIFNPPSPGSRWRRKNLKYKISKYPKNLSPKDVDRAISRAFSAWSNVTNLTFAPSKGNADIEIKFETAKHNDEKPFDGAGGAFAHAFFPNHGGDVHFDASEGWTTNTKDGTDLFQVAVHELGHSLGLEHSNVKEALMAPFYGSYNPHFKLHEDDIRGIQALYGGKAKRRM